jgi:dTDP-4-amino-4,6-dideoxygalactose transaminase
MSEAQAAIALLTLQDMPVIFARNAGLYQVYRDGLAGIPGLALIAPSNMSRSNYSCAVCVLEADLFGLDGAALCDALRRENIGARPGLAPSVLDSPFFAEWVGRGPDTLESGKALGDKLIRLPLGTAVSEADVAAICDRIAAIQAAAASIREALGSAA